jgi:preprotein translocase subunit SecD
MKSQRTSQIVVALAVLLFCSVMVSAEESVTRVEVRKAEFEPFPGADQAYVKGSERPIYIAAEAEFTNRDLASVKAVGDPNGEPGLELILTQEAAVRMESFSIQWIGKPLAIMVNGDVVLAPVVRAVLGERLIVQGSFTLEQVESLAANFH